MRDNNTVNSIIGLLGHLLILNPYSVFIILF